MIKMDVNNMNFRIETDRLSEVKVICERLWGVQMCSLEHFIAGNDLISMEMIESHAILKNTKKV